MERPDITSINTVPELFWHNVENYRDDITMWRKQRGVWESHTWGDYGDWSRDIGHALISLIILAISRVSWSFIPAAGSSKSINFGFETNALAISASFYHQ